MSKGTKHSECPQLHSRDRTAKKIANLYSQDREILLPKIEKQLFSQGVLTNNNFTPYNKKWRDKAWGTEVSRKFAALTALLGLLLYSDCVAVAQDTAFFLPGTIAKSRIAVNHGNAKPPEGFLKFCERSPVSCMEASVVESNYMLSKEQWQVVDHVNRDVNRKILSISDLELYNTKEFWTFPAKAGDCEDYVLLKRQQLVDLGIPISVLLITVVLDEHGEGHAVLTVSTATGDYILDNRRNEILHWSFVNYKFLKRQSSNNQVQWIALAPQRNQATLVASGDDAP